MADMKWLFLCSLFLFLSCPGAIQAPPAKPGSGIPVASGNEYPSDLSNNLYPGHPNSPNDPNNPNNNDPNNLKDASVTLPSDRKWGLVRCDNSENYERFNEAVRSFLTASANPNTMNWQVKCDFKPNSQYKNQKGGVFIRGRVSFESGRFNPVSPSQNLLPSRNSSLEIHLVDQFSKTIINPIKLNIDELSSSVSGNNVTLVFKDEKGEVTLKGTVAKNPKINDYTISGQMDFINYVDYTGAARRYGGFLGYFEIPACSLLVCSSSRSPEGL